MEIETLKRTLTKATPSESDLVGENTPTPVCIVSNSASRSSDKARAQASRTAMNERTVVKTRVHQTSLNAKRIEKSTSLNICRVKKRTRLKARWTVKYMTLETSLTRKRVKLIVDLTKNVERR